MDEKALRTELGELRHLIANLQGKHAEHGKDEHAHPTQSLTTQHSYPPPDAPPPPAPPPKAVASTCDSSAGDLGGLSDSALNELDDGLKAIARQMVLRAAGAPPATATDGPLSRTKQDMIALLNKVSLRTDPAPGVVPGVNHFAAFRDPARGRNVRLNDARQLQFGLIPEEDRSCLMYFETFVQLVQFRGIDVEELL